MATTGACLGFGYDLSRDLRTYEDPQPGRDIGAGLRGNSLAQHLPLLSILPTPIPLFGMCSQIGFHGRDALGSQLAVDAGVQIRFGTRRPLDFT